MCDIGRMEDIDREEGVDERLGMIHIFFLEIRGDRHKEEEGRFRNVGGTTLFKNYIKSKNLIKKKIYKTVCYLSRNSPNPDPASHSNQSVESQ